MRPRRINTYRSRSVNMNVLRQKRESQKAVLREVRKQNVAKEGALAPVNGRE